MFRVLEFIVLDGIGFYGGFRTRNEAAHFAAQINGKVATLPSNMVRRVINPKRSAHIIGKAKGFYCESAYTITTTYRKDV